MNFHRHAALLALSLGLAACGSDPTPETVWKLDELTADKGFSFRSPVIDVPAGVETQQCFFVKVPDLDNGRDLWIDEIVSAVNPGSHHVNVFRVKEIVRIPADPSKELDPAKGQPFRYGNTSGTMIKDGACFGPSSNWATWPLVTNTQKSSPNDPYLRWKLPENVAQRFTPGEQLMVQLHYVNAATQTTPYKGKVGVNFVKTTAASPMELGTLFATQQSIRVCQSNPAPSYKGTCSFPAGTNVRVAAANGHFHSRGKRFRMFSWDGVSTTQPADAARFYTSSSWDEPPMTVGLDVQLPAGGGIWWTCDYQWQAPPSGCAAVNARDPQMANDCCYTFGPVVETSEHCNAFVYYWPKAAGKVSCN